MRGSFENVMNPNEKQGIIVIIKKTRDRRRTSICLFYEWMMYLYLACTSEM